jgi:hypothetical protein
MGVSHRVLIEAYPATCSAAISALKDATEKCPISDGLPSGDLPPKEAMPAATKVPVAVSLCPGGFEYRGHPNKLSGRPLQMLKAMLGSRHLRCTRDELRKSMGIDDDAVSYPEKVVIDTGKKLRAALLAALRASGQKCDDFDPLPSTGEGADLTYSLNMP